MVGAGRRDVRHGTCQREGTEAFPFLGYARHVSDNRTWYAYGRWRHVRLKLAACGLAKTSLMHFCSALRSLLPMHLSCTRLSLFALLLAALPASVPAADPPKIDLV